MVAFWGLGRHTAGLATETGCEWLGTRKKGALQGSYMYMYKGVSQVALKVQ